MSGAKKMVNVILMEDDAKFSEVITERPMDARRGMEAEERCDVRGGSPTIEGGI